MELRTYIAILRRRKWIVILTTILITALAGVYSYVATPIYSSETTVRVATAGSGAIGGYTDVIYSDRLSNTYARIVNGGATKGEIMQEFGLTERPQITAEVIPNTELLRIIAEAPNPALAQGMAALSAQILIAKSRELYSGEGQSTQDILLAQLQQMEGELAILRKDFDEAVANGQAGAPGGEAAAQAVALKEQSYATLLDQYERVRLNEAVRVNAVSIVEPAYLPIAPSKPRTNLNLVLGFVVGLFMGVALALVADNVDTTLHSSVQVETLTGLPALGRIPPASQSLGLVNLNGHLDLAQVESYRRLRVNLLNFDRQSQPRSFLMTSAKSGEGKSTVVANLAIAIAKSGRSVVVVDCDLHSPTQDNLFGLPNDVGLTTVLTKQATAAGVTQTTEVPNLRVITTGPPLYDEAGISGTAQLAPSALADRLDQGTEFLGSLQMGSLIDDLKQNFDFVILDSPAMLAITDATVMAPLVDAVLLIVASDHSQRDEVRAARSQLDTVQANVVGVVVIRDRESIRLYRHRKRA